MVSFDDLYGFLQTVYNITSCCLEVVWATTVSIIDVNYEVMSRFLTICADAIKVLVHVFSGLFYVISVLFQAAFEFFAECVNFLSAFVQLLWKFTLLLLSVGGLILNGLEQVFHFVMSGGCWTAGAIKTVLFNVQDLLRTYLSHSEGFMRKCFTSTTNGLTVLGTVTYKALVYFFNFMKWAVFDTCLWLDGALMSLVDTIRYVLDSVYYFITDNILYTRKEIYLGVLIVLLTFLIITKFSQLLNNRGMTFPFPTDFGREDLNERRHRFRFHLNEFSDDEGISDVDLGDTDSTLSEEDEDDDDDDDNNRNGFMDEDSDETNSEFSVEDDDDASSTHSNATTSADIDIQLPSTHDEQYNLRRSTTPSRTSITSPEDFEKEIEREREKQTCVVCHDNKKSVLILPCRHMCLCVNCGNTIARARAVNRRVCPLCRQKITTIMNVYV